MKKFLVLLFFVFVSISSVLAADIKYGYNAHGNYVPTSYGTDRINYGYRRHNRGLL